MKKTLLSVIIANFCFYWMAALVHGNSNSQGKRPLNLGAVSREDLNHFLDEILRDKEEGLPTSTSCKSRFEVEDGVILRTRDSINSGAEFLAAPSDVDTVDDCRLQCCETVSKKTSRHCDFVVFQELNTETDRSRCFLFSCTTSDGKDACLTTQNADYKVLRLKEEKVENQLLNVVSNSSNAGDEDEGSEAEDAHGVCSKQFTMETGVIIRTRDSIKNGALFLEAPSDVNSIEKCQSQCCTSTGHSGTSRHCDLAVYQANDDDPEDSLPRCYLFSCRDKSGRFRCITSPNNDYVSMKRRAADMEEDELFDVSKSTSTTSSRRLVTTAPFETSATSTAMPVTSTAAVSTTRWPAKSSSIAAVNVLSCRRLEWQCDDGSCIKVTKVCNGKPECSDKSDEVGCEDLLDGEDVGSKSNPELESKASIENESQDRMTTKVSTKSPATSATTSKIEANLTKQESHSESNVNIKTTEKSKKTAPISTPPNFVGQQDFVAGKTEPQKGAVLPLALGLSVTTCVLLMVGCRVHIMKKKLRRRGKPLSMEESDYLINGMYL